MKLSYLCFALAYGLLIASAQRPQGIVQNTSIITTAGTTANITNSTPTTTTNTSSSTPTITPLSYPAAASGGPSANSATPNISIVNNSTTATGPTTITSPDNSTSPFTLALLQAIEQNHTTSSYPTQNYTLFLVDIHFYGGNLSSQYIAYHYCHFVSADFMQCALYNGRGADARFIGNEYFVTQAIFNTLPAWERNLWHAHPFEVQSGLFVAPDLSPEEDLEVQQWLMGTFGKVTDTWRYYDDFPMGPPQLGVALSLASQVNWTLATQMDQLLNLGTTYQQRQQQRTGLVTPARTAGSDNYLFSGYGVNYEVYSFSLENNSTLLGAANATGPALTNQTAAVTSNVTLPASEVSLDNLPTSSPEAGPGAFDSLPNPEAPTTIGAEVDV